MLSSHLTVILYYLHTFLNLQISILPQNFPSNNSQLFLIYRTNIPRLAYHIVFNLKILTLFCEDYKLWSPLLCIILHLEFYTLGFNILLPTLYFKNLGNIALNVINPWNGKAQYLWNYLVFETIFVSCFCEVVLFRLQTETYGWVRWGTDKVLHMKFNYSSPVDERLRVERIKRVREEVCAIISPMKQCPLWFSTQNREVLVNSALVMGSMGRVI